MVTLGMASGVMPSNIRIGDARGSWRAGRRRVAGAGARSGRPGVAVGAVVPSGETTFSDPRSAAEPELPSSSSSSSSSSPFFSANVRLPQDVQSLEDAFAAAVAEDGSAKMESPYESLLDEPRHYAATALAMTLIAANAAEACASCPDVASGLAAAAAGYLAADLGSGVYHWSVDNYGSISTPWLGHQIAAFQGHHAAPFTIARRGGFNNAAPGAVAMMPFLLAMLALPACTGYVQLGWSAFVGSIFAAQPLHRWSHMPRSKMPAAIRLLQDTGIAIPSIMHMKHHNGTFEGSYCIVGGLWNPLLDGTNFFRMLEGIVEARTGVLPKWRRDVEAAAHEKGL